MVIMGVWAARKWIISLLTTWQYFIWKAIIQCKKQKLLWSWWIRDNRFEEFTCLHKIMLRKLSDMLGGVFCSIKCIFFSAILHFNACHHNRLRSHKDQEAEASMRSIYHFLSWEILCNLLTFWFLLSPQRRNFQEHELEQDSELLQNTFQ